MGDARTYWDRHATASNLPGEESLTAERWEEEIAFYLTPEQEWAHKALGQLESRRVAEIGCGVGVHAIYLSQQRAWVVAVDSSLQRLKVLREVAGDKGVGSRIHAVCARAENLPFRCDSLDAAYTKATLIHTDLPASLRECRRVLRTAGRGVFCEPTTSNPFARLYRRFFGPPDWRAITRYFSRAEEKMLEGMFGGFRRKSFYLWSFIAFYWQFRRKRLKRFRRWLRVLYAIDRALFAICPPLKRLAWFRVYVVEKK